MLGWLWRMIVGRFGCEHKWAEVDVKPYERNHEFGGKSQGNAYILRCEKCGNMKRWLTCN